MNKGKLAIVFGAGKTGRGYAAHLAHLSGYELVFVDKDTELVNQLAEKGMYQIEILGNPEKNCTISDFKVFHIHDDRWIPYFSDASIALVSVFGTNLKELSKDLLKALNVRHQDAPHTSLNILTFENYTNAAAHLKENVIDGLSDPAHFYWINEKIGFAETMVFRTCIEASAEQDPLTVRAQDLFHLPCDGENVVGESVDLFGIELLNEFSNQLRRKIYTYNCINGVITYLGAKKRYQWLYEAANDPEILTVATEAARESSEAQLKVFGFDPAEQQDWVKNAFSKFADPNIPDPINRNGDDPARKLGRDDRLIGPAILALQTGTFPNALLDGIEAAFHYKDSRSNSSVMDLVQSRGIDNVLQDICGLDPEEALFDIIKQRI